MTVLDLPDGARKGHALEPATAVPFKGDFRALQGRLSERITVDADPMGGAPTIRGLRIPVATVVSMVADGMTADEIVDDLPDLTPDDVAEALRDAAETVRERRLPLRPSA